MLSSRMLRTYLIGTLHFEEVVLIRYVSENVSSQLIEAARSLSDKVDRMKFGAPVTHVYNPLTYAWKAHETFLKRFGGGRKKIVFLGMNPGPFGMAQIGIPFGEIAAARDWMGIREEISKPSIEHPKRPILGFDCPRSEVSGRRLWGLFAQRFGTPEKFFADHFVVNYCPLAFCSETGANLTPDKFPRSESEPLFKACDEHLRRVLEVIQPEWLIGVGGFAKQRGEAAIGGSKIQLGQILHPSPASPAANRDWAGMATKELVRMGIWK